MKIIKKCFLLLAIYLLILIIGQSIPKEWVVENAAKSYETLKAQGFYGEIVKDICWDNWTDSYFINAAVTDYDGNIFERAIANAYTVASRYENEPIEGIRYAIASEGKETYQVAYSRYWAGGSTLVKILLLFTDISGIRSIVLMVALVLFGITGINIYNTVGSGGDCIWLEYISFNVDSK